MGKRYFLGNLNNRGTVINPAHQIFLGLVEMTFGLVHASYSLPEWQAVKLTFFAPWSHLCSRDTSTSWKNVQVLFVLVTSIEGTHTSMQGKGTLFSESQNLGLASIQGTPYPSKTD